MVSTRCHSSERQFGPHRERVARERQEGTVAKSLIGRRSTRKRAMTRSIGRVSTSKGGGQLDRRHARGVPSPCAIARIKGTNRGMRGKLISDHGLFSSYEGQQGAANGQDYRGIFQGCTGPLDDRMLARASASPARCLHRYGLRSYNFLCR